MRNSKNRFKNKKITKRYKAHSEEEFYEEDIQEDEYMPDVFSDEYINLTAESVFHEKLLKSEKLDDDINEKYGNAFPLNIFPDKILRLILNAEETIGLPVDFFASSILSAVSTAIRGKFRLEFKDSFVESAALMMVLVGRPGINKSHPLKIALEPLYELEKESYNEYISQENEEEDTIRKRYIISDATIESVANLLTQNPSGLLLHSDEFSGFLDGMDKYRQGDDVQKWLSIWSNMPISIDRVSKEPQFLQDPFITIAGTIQPDLLYKFTEKNRSHNGFIDRVLFAYPSGLKSKPWSIDNLDNALYNEYKRIIRAIAMSPESFYENSLKPTKLRYTPQVVEYLLRWQKQNTNLINSYTETNLISMYKKLEIYIHRLALIIAILDYCSKDERLLKSNNIKKLPIHIEHIKKAVELIEYYRNNAIKVHDKQAKANPVEKLDADTKRWYERLPEEVVTADALRYATQYDISKRKAQYLLADDTLFIKKKRGLYYKKYYTIKEETSY